MVHNETSKRFVEGVASKPLITIFGQISNSLSNQCGPSVIFSWIFPHCPVVSSPCCCQIWRKDYERPFNGNWSRLQFETLRTKVMNLPTLLNPAHHAGWILRQPTSLSLGLSIVLHAMQRCFWWRYEDFDLGSCNMLLSFLVLSTLLFWVSIQWTENVKVTLILTAGDKDDDYIKVVHVWW